MTPLEALQLLDNVCSQVNLTRQQHQQIAEASRVIESALAAAQVAAATQ